MRHLSTSVKIVIGAAVGMVVLLIQLAITLDTIAFYALLAVTFLGYLAGLYALIERRRYRLLALAGVGTILFIAFGIAFLRAWGIAFTDAASAGSSLRRRNSDAYFYLSAASLLGTLGMLFVSSLWPVRRAKAVRRSKPTQRKRPPTTSKRSVAPPRSTRARPVTPAVRRSASASHPPRPARPKTSPAPKRPSR